MKQRAAPIRRVIRSRRDDRYQAGVPTGPKRAASGWVVGVDEDTVTVRILGEDITGVIPIGEMPPCGAICEVESRRDVLVIPRWYPGPEPLAYVAYPTPLGYQGPYTYLGWDGGSQVVGESQTNNARYFGIDAPVTADGPQYGPGAWGFTETSTSNAPYNQNASFVRSGMVPILGYRDSDTAHYGVVVLAVNGTDVSTLSRLAYPSQVFTSADFLRLMVAWNDAEIWCYGAGGGVVHVWETALDGAGNLTTFVGGSNVTKPAFWGSSYYLNGQPIIFSQHLAIDPHRGLYTRTDSQTIRSPDDYIPASGGCPINLDMGFFAGQPYHLHCIRRTSTGPGGYHHIADLMCTSNDGTSGWSVVDTWDIPAGATRVVAGLTGRGKVVAYVDDGSTVRGFYDVHGAAEEFEAENHFLEPGFTVFDVGPIIPEDLPSSQDAWLAGDSAGGLGGYLHLVVRGGCS